MQLLPFCENWRNKIQDENKIKNLKRKKKENEKAGNDVNPDKETKTVIP